MRRVRAFVWRSNMSGRLPIYSNTMIIRILILDVRVLCLCVCVSGKWWLCICGRYFRFYAEFSFSNFLRFVAFFMCGLCVFQDWCAPSVERRVDRFTSQLKHNWCMFFECVTKLDNWLSSSAWTVLSMTNNIISKHVWLGWKYIYMIFCMDSSLSRKRFSTNIKIK